MLKQLSYLWIVVLIFSLAACDGDKQDKKPIVKRVKTVIVGVADAQSLRRFPGKILPAEQSQLSFEVSGRVYQLPVNEGDKVEKGQLLAALESEKFQDTFDKTEAKLKLAKAQYERGKVLVEKGHISRSDFDKLQSSFDVANAELTSAKRNLDDTKLFAPYAGTIAKIFIDNHQDIQAKQATFLLQDLSELNVEMSVPENFIIQLKKTDKLSFHVVFESFPKKSFPATLKEYSTIADPDTQAYRAELKMSRPDDLSVLPGMTASVAITRVVKQGTEPHFLLPSGAVIVDADNKAFVWRVNEVSSKVEKQPVTVNRLSGGDIEVLSGLKKGEHIVAAGGHLLQAGEEVRSVRTAKDQ